MKKHSSGLCGCETATSEIVCRAFALAAISAVTLCASEVFAAPQPAGIMVSYWPAFLGFAVLLVIAGAILFVVFRAKKQGHAEDAELWKTVAGNVADLVLVVNATGKITYVNRDDAPYQSLIGAHSKLLFDPIEKTRWLSVLATVSGSGDSAETVFKVRPPESVAQFWAIRTTRLEDSLSEGNVLICARDVTMTHHREVTRDILLNIAEASISGASLDEFYETVRKELARIVDTSNSYLALYDATDGAYTFPMVHDSYTESDLRSGKQDLTGGLTDYVRLSAEPLLLNDENRDTLCAQLGVRSMGQRAQCWLGMPLKHETGVFGVFVIQSYDDPAAFGPEDIKLLKIVTDSISNAVLRKRAVAELALNESKLRLLTDRMPALMWSLDNDGRITFITGVALQQLGLDPKQLVEMRLDDVFQLGMNSEAKFASDSGVPGDIRSVRLSCGARNYEGFTEAICDPQGIVAGSIGVALDTTERNLLAEELETYFALSDDSLVVFDEHGKIVRANRANYRRLGYSEEELVGIGVEGLIHPDDVAMAYRELANLQEGSVTLALEIRLIGKSGEVHWYTWNAMRIGTLGHTYCSGKDITARKSNEEALAYREEQLRLFVEHAPAAVAMFDRDMRYIVASRRWYKDFELSHESVVGLHHYEVFPEIPERWKEIHQRCLAGASESCERDEFPRSDGRSDWLKWEVLPWHDADHAIGGLIMFCEVITAQVIADRELEKSRNLARSILSTSLDAVVSMDGDGIVTDWNERAEKIFGYAHDEAVGEFLHHLIVPERFRGAHVRGLAKFREAGHGHVLNKLLRLEACCKDGSTIPVEVSIAPYQVGEETRFAAFLRDIRQQVMRETELRQSRESLAEAQRLAGLGSWEWYPQEDRVFYSLEKRRITGIPEDVQYLEVGAFLESVHSEDRGRVMAAMSAALQSHVIEPIEYRIVRPDGGLVHVRTQGKVELDDSGEIRRFFGTTWDVTQHVETAELVRASEERLALALDGSSDGFWDWNVETGDCFFSSRILEWLELNPETFRYHHQSWEDMVHPEDRKRFFIAFQEHVAHRTSHYEIEERVKTTSGKWIWVLSRGKVVEWMENGCPLRAAGTWSNITERKSAEERAVRLGRVVEQTHSEVYMVDPQSLKFIEVNKSACRNLGYEMSELSSMSVVDLFVDPSDFDAEVYRPLFSGAAPWVEHRFVHRRKDGSTYPVALKTELLSGSGGQLLLSVGVDATQEEQGRHERERLESRLRQSQRMETIGTLAGGIAHDFNNILTPILGYADMARIELDENARSREDIERVIEAAYRAKGLVQQILAFCSESEQPSTVLKSDAIIHETLQLLKPVIPPNIELIEDLEKGIFVRSDVSQMHQIVMNLVTNALHAIGESGGEIRVKTRSHQLLDEDCPAGSGLTAGAWMCFSVSDTGCGMSEESKKRIFEPFYTTKSVGQGTGLGLSVVHGLVNSHKGVVQVESRLGEGTEIRIWLPASPNQHDSSSTIETEALEGNERILFCDDDEGIATLGKQMLSAFGYEVHEHISASSALAEFEAFGNQINLLILSDTFSTTQLDLLAALRTLDPGLPSILLASGAVTRETAEHHTLVLSKPVSAADLARGVRQALQKSNKVQEDTRVSHTCN
ncbi:PAS domain S-box protein [bacterium]|nr:PAS domain S-box protein [bacterium]